MKDVCVIDEKFYEENIEFAKKFVEGINRRAGELGHTAKTIAIAAKLDSDIFDDIDHVLDRLDIYDLRRIAYIFGCKSSELLKV